MTVGEEGKKGRCESWHEADARAVQGMDGEVVTEAQSRGGSSMDVAPTKVSVSASLSSSNPRLTRPHGALQIRWPRPQVQGGFQGDSKTRRLVIQSAN